MSTYEALGFFGLDHYATASDIKAAYRRLATAARSDAAMDDAADVRMQMLQRAYDALHHRVDHTQADIDPQTGTDAGEGPGVMAASLRGLWARMFRSERWMQIVFSPLGLLPIGKAVALFVVVIAVSYGIVRGVAGKSFASTVVAAKTVTAPRVVATLPVKVARVAVVAKVQPARAKEPSVAAVPRRLRAPALPGVDPEEAKAIGSACLAETGESADAFQACVLRTARETPHAIHLE